MTEAPILSVSGLTKSFRGRRAVDDVYLDVYKGEVIALIGPSGCGKSTLLRCMTWLEQPDDGFITIEGQPFGRERRGNVIVHQSRRTVDALRPKVGLVFQQLNLWPHLTVLENVVRAQTVVLRRSRHEAIARADGLFATLGLSAKADAFPYTLSGGQRQRVAIARALAMDPIVMLFDEPTSALDPELVGDVLSLLRQLASSGVTMIVVTHEVGFAISVADRIAVMDHGKIIEDGPKTQVLDNPSSERGARYLAHFARTTSYDIAREEPV